MSILIQHCIGVNDMNIEYREREREIERERIPQASFTISSFGPLAVEMLSKPNTADTGEVSP